MRQPYRVLDRLTDRLHRARPEDLPALTAEAAIGLGGSAAVLYLVDYDQLTLVPFVEPGGVTRDPVSIDGTLAGRAYIVGVPHWSSDENGLRRLWLPVVDGTDRLGVLEVTVRTGQAHSEAGPVSGTGGGHGQRLVRRLQTLATLLAEVLTARRTYGDAIERIRRRLPMQLAAEVIWTQLPPLTFTTDSATITAVLEPCYDVGGDAFDYAVNGPVFHVAIFDTMGHGLAASSVTSLGISAYRNARRCGLDLVDTYRSIDKWVHAQYPDSYLTAILGELDTATGSYRRISAGHPGELLLRDGRLVRELATPTAMPMGLGRLGNRIPTVAQEMLQPGDQLLLYTDGMIEARDGTGDLFGVQRLSSFATKALADELPAPETMRRLIHAVLSHQEGNLQDDATAVLLGWHPGTAGTGIPWPV